MKRAFILLILLALMILSCSKKTTTNNYYYTYPSAESAIVGIVHPPESQATVTAYMALPVASTQIDSNGYYKISGLLAGTYSILVQADGYNDYSTKPYIHLSGEETAVMDTIYLMSIHDLVTSVYPNDGQLNVRTDDRIRIAFRRAMNRESVESAFNFEPEVSGEFTWSSSHNSLQFVPDQRFATSTLYKVTIDTSASDTAGIKLAEPYQFSFTTESLKVEYTSPQHNATEVSPLTDVYIIFNTEMDIESVISAFLMEDSGHNNVSGDFPGHYPDRIEFHPDSTLAAAETYTVTIDTGASDLNGKKLPEPYVFSFTTASVKVVSTYPSNNQTWVSPNITVQIYFSTFMNTESVDSAFKMTDSELNEVTGEFIWVRPERMEFHPWSFLATSETYVVTIDTTARSDQGERMPDPYQFSFTTQPIRIESTKPHHKETWVSPGTSVAIIFNTDMDMESVNSAFQMVDSGLNQVSGTFMWYSPSQLQFRPESVLAFDETYTITIGTDAMDLQGHNMKNPFSFWFKTYPE
jgi:hypothetical protein